MTNREKLEKLIEKAENLIANERDYFTEGNILAIERLISSGKKALNGETKLPFVRNRGFYAPREEEEILFEIQHTTKTPSYFMKDYGLEPVLSWFEKTRDTKENVIEKNKAREKRLSEINIVSDNLFFRGSTEENRNHMKVRLEKDKILKKQFEGIEEISNRYSADEIDMIFEMLKDDADYETLNEHFYIWGKTDKILTFVTPKKACFAKIKFTLPSVENSKDGLGHFWIDDIVVSPAMGDDWKVENPGFEDDINGWELFSTKGNPVLRHEKRKNYCGKDKGSIYYENPTADDEGGFVSKDFIEIQGDVNHTITFFAKIDGIFKQGIKVEIEFFDENKGYIDSVSWNFKRRASLATVDFALTAQADAIMYFVNDHKEKGIKAKKQLFFLLNDFCQGIEHWLVFDSRPLGSDAYGAVQGGRILCSVASVYTFIKDLFTEEEKERFIEYIEYFIEFLMDLRDRTELSDEEAQADAGNWQTDMAAGVGMMMMAMPEFPNSKSWLLNANKVLFSQLKCNVNSDGSWPESIRYHFAALGRFALYAYVLRNCTGEDWFTKANINKMFRFPIMIQTPKYEYYNNLFCTPNFGDHDLCRGEQFAVHGVYASTVYEIDRKLGEIMFKTWQDLNMPVGAFGNGENVLFQNLIGDSTVFEDNLPEVELCSTDEFVPSGVIVLRGEEQYLSLMASPKNVAHGHYDEGAFIYYKENVPVIVDPGIESYFDSTKDWYVSSSAHSCVQFARKDGIKEIPDEFSLLLEKTDYSATEGWNDTPRYAKVLEFSATDESDEVKIQVDNIEGGAHIRHIVMNKIEKTVTITDTVENYNGKLRANFPLAAVATVINGNSAKADCYYGKKLELEFDGDIEKISVEKGRSLKMFPCDGMAKTDTVRVEFKNKLTTIIR